MNSKSIGSNLCVMHFNFHDFFKVILFSIYKLPKKIKKNKNYVECNNIKFNLKTLFGKGIPFFCSKTSIYYFNILSFKIFYKELINSQNHNILHFNLYGVSGTFKYLIYCRNQSFGLHSKIKTFNNIDICMYIRQGSKNIMDITVRKNNITDKNRFKIFFAWLCSLPVIKSKKILLYEKNCNRYEESASIVYERLVDLGYPAYFIIRKDSYYINDIPEKYKNNIIYAYSFKHYLYYFICKKFISSESFPHAMETGNISFFVNLKIKLKRFKFVFLQHGVMYMVSMDANTRDMFQKGKHMPKDAKIIVSSKLEAEHFVKIGGYSMDDLYITGLASYDRNIKNADAKKITIMPTWRPWDANILENDPEKSSYYRFISDIVDAIPKKYKNQIIVLPHPLVVEKFKNTKINKYIPTSINYDKILEDTDILITDYSSIAYSAFYRGGKVIFVWKEKEDCMKKYNARLMLNEQNAFGDICYDLEKLRSLIDNNYLNDQNKKYINNYRKIVEYHDNKNTDRIINLLKKDKFFN